MTQRLRIVIVGGGFGGLYAAQHLKHAPFDITLIDRRNFHLFQPLLYQVATGGLSPANISAPLRAILKHQRNTRVLLGEVTGLNVAHKQVVLKDGSVIPYDKLILATGMTHNYFGHEQWAERAPGLKSIEDATAIRKKILMAFEMAELETDPQQQAQWLSFVVIGGGPTGVELAGALAEISHETLKGNFRNCDPASARITLLEGGPRILAPFPEKLSAAATASLQKLGVQVQTQALVTDIQADGVTYKHQEQTVQLPARTVVWAAGVKASPLSQIVAQATGAEQDRSGRVMVGADLTIAGHPDIFVLGDMANAKDPQGQPFPGVAQVAMQQGAYVAQLLQSSSASPPPFVYKDLGSMATIGRSLAVVKMGSWEFSGFMAWLAWLFVHVINLVQYESRLQVALQWAWNYVTRNRSARLITGDESSSASDKKEPAGGSGR